MADSPLKTCACCKQAKPRTDFPVKSSNKDGLYSYCKPCNVAKVRGYLAKRNDWKDYKREYDRARNKRLAPEIKKKAQERRARNPEKYAQRAKEWVQKNPEKRRVISQNYKHRRRAQESGGISTSDLAKWQAAQPRKCYWCGDKKADAYTVDHYVPLAKGGKHEIENLVIACRPCNLRKCAKDPFDFARQVGRLL